MLGDGDGRPTTAHRVQNQTRGVDTLIEEDPGSALKALDALRRLYDIKNSSTEVERSSDAELAAGVPCPPSPVEDMQPRPGPSREDTIPTVLSSTSTSMGNLSTPLTSPSEATSPISIVNPFPLKGHNADQILAYQSDPSLPALLSSTSSVSADPEGDFLGDPGVPSTSSILETTDSLTPPALGKEPIAGFPLDAREDMLREGTVAIELDNRIPRPSAMATRPTASKSAHDDEDDSDSDEGLTMGRSRNHNRSKDLSPAAMGRVLTTSRRRDTNGSVRSTDTAKKLIHEGAQITHEDSTT
jgi:[calcium/calmodulin-dependent protein kinase] kinase